MNSNIKELLLGNAAVARAFCAMKHVGLNVAADPLYTASYIGTNGGMVCAVADDPGMHSSQNEQDSRHHAIASKVPMLEPSSSQECKDYAMLAFELSEKYDTPVLLRLSTRISHSRSPVTIGSRNDVPLRGYKKDPQKHVMMPAMARARHLFVEERTEKLREYAETSGINKTEYNSDAIGIICAGTTYNYAKEAMGKNASYLKLGMVNPLPVKLIKDFASKVKRLVVIEELDDIIETHCLKNGIPCEGKNLFPVCGEFSQSIVRKALTGEENSYVSVDCELPPRPLCRMSAQRIVLRTEGHEAVCQRRHRMLYSRSSGTACHDRYLRLHGCVGQRTARLQHCPRQRRRKELRRRNR